MMQKQLWLLFFGVVLFAGESRAMQSSSPNQIENVAYVCVDGHSIYAHNGSGGFDVYSLNQNSGEFEYCGARFVKVVDNTAAFFQSNKLILTPLNGFEGYFIDSENQSQIYKFGLGGLSPCTDPRASSHISSNSSSSSSSTQSGDGASSPNVTVNTSGHTAINKSANVDSDTDNVLNNWWEDNGDWYKNNAIKIAQIVGVSAGTAWLASVLTKQYNKLTGKKKKEEFHPARVALVVGSIAGCLTLYKCYFYNPTR